MLIGLLLAAQIVVSLALIGVVLLQRSEGGGFVGGGSPSGMMSVRGVGDLLTRTTWILGSAFFIIALVLTILQGREKGGSSVVDRLKIDNVDPSTLNQPKPAQPGNPQSAPAPLQAPAPTINNPFLGQPAQPAPSAPPQQ
ncbi:MAG TPA: preprotein translocase subunit SecG [Phenylobacterium sp.]|jgi:preprotein translocase subunit SecG|uniref:preprotein translocase subunit SecG n=1 Tax=Phenylobacterium sp. TaxID=1871053 RepID=UPI002BD762C3|nr:preprotein translocase subunit SecG [Phenylobacterium sp.]HXA38542.1 preprotein translocase subunit SecG [Phenylobacterium sp.]